MLLFCRYGVDTSDPSLGIVVAHYADGQAPERDAHPGCTLVRHDGPFEALDRFGPAPEAREPGDPRPPVTDWRPRAAPRLDVSVARTAKLAELSDACGLAIAGGFTSSALGGPNVYPSADEDQRNLALAAGAALAGQSKPGWAAALKCSPVGQKAVRRPHTAAQVHAALGDFVAMKEASTAKLDDLKARLTAAETVDAVAAIAWG